MKIRDHLNDGHQKKKLQQKVKLSEKDLRELMGVNRDTYKKVNGKWRMR